VTTWGETGTGNGQFMGLNDAALDSNGNIYVPDQFNHRIQKFDRDGNYLDQWGTFGTGNGHVWGASGRGLSKDLPGRCHIQGLRRLPRYGGDPGWPIHDGVAFK